MVLDNGKKLLRIIWMPLKQAMPGIKVHLRRPNKI
ncbi:hypothetical protein AAULR_10190 [Lacticaseibacillus rhamnosus MTCC 5462]|nr:hypothetical protein AAULR_10190 [Lacticaseibacillus rhamnosus MTCC 5462]